MKKYQTLYVAASKQHVGKTTSTLGLAYCLQRLGVDVGYCKPVGQQFVDLNDLKVDKDTILFSDLIRFDLMPEIHSPVILGAGATTSYLDNPEEFDYPAKILKAKAALEQRKELTIHEGTGHPGVGSVVNLSNARVAKMLDAQVIFIAEGGVGSTIDMINMCISLFREEGVKILGIIVNKVREDKIEKIRPYLQKYLDGVGIPLLGMVPYDRTLAYPVMGTVAKAIFAKIIANPHTLKNKVADVLAGSVIDRAKLEKRKNLLLVVGAVRLESAIELITEICEESSLEKWPLSGIIICGEGEISDETRAIIDKHETPLLQTELDTYGVVLKVSRIEVKINRDTPWKIKRAIDLFEANVDLDYILEQISKP
jgi:BioD-like phosphotransacetylase family protein